MTVECGLAHVGMAGHPTQPQEEGHYGRQPRKRTADIT